jgi:hypothetical protein
MPRKVSHCTAFVPWVLLAAALTTAGMSACGHSSSGAVSPPVKASDVPVAATPQASVPQFRGMLPVVCTQRVYDNGEYRSIRTVDGVRRMRHPLWRALQKSSDPRLSGRQDVVINVDQRQADGSSTLWGTSVVRNAAGAWAGKWTGGIAASGDVHYLNMTMTGAGDYAGLVYRRTGTFVEAGKGFTPDVEIVCAGRIETADGSPVPSAPGPGTTPADWTPVVGIATTVRTAYDRPGPWVRDLEQSDSRLSGRLEGDLEEIGYPRTDGSIDYRSWSTVTNQDGAWKSLPQLDVRGPGPRKEHFVSWTSAGSGAYEGLTYHGFWFFPEPRDIVPGDTFVYTGWVEETE